MRQNDHIAYERIRKRSAELNDERLRIYRVTSDLDLVDITLNSYLQKQAPHIRQGPRFEDAADRLSEGVMDLHKSAGLMWGAMEVQALRADFIDDCLRASNKMSEIIRESKLGEPLQHQAITRRRPEWNILKDGAFGKGVQLHTLVDFERQRTALQIARLEKVLF